MGRRRVVFQAPKNGRCCSRLGFAGTEVSVQGFDNVEILGVSCPQDVGTLNFFNCSSVISS
jgi:hypothetical protein